MDALTGLPLTLTGALAVISGGGWVLAFWFGRMVYRGDLIAKDRVKQELDYRDEQVKLWREAEAVSSAQSEALLTGLTTVEQMLRGLIDQKDPP